MMSAVLGAVSAAAAEVEVEPQGSCTTNLLPLQMYKQSGCINPENTSRTETAPKQPLNIQISFLIQVSKAVFHLPVICTFILSNVE